MAKKQELFTEAQRQFTIQRLRELKSVVGAFYKITKGTKVARASMIAVVDEGKDMKSESLAKIGEFIAKTEF